MCEEGGGVFGVSLFFSPLCTSAVNHKHLLALLVTEAVCAAAGIRLMLGSRHFTAKRDKNKGVILVLRAVQVSVANSTILTYLSS